MAEVNITYNGKEISVSKEVADFLEQDRKRIAAQGRSDRRHLSMGDAERESSYWFRHKHDLENTVILNLMKESLHKALNELSEEDWRLIELYYWEDKTMQQIADEFGISKMAVYKRHKKILNGLRAVIK